MTETGDQRPTDKARAFVADWLESGGGHQELVDGVCKLYTELINALEEMESMVPYVGDYFDEKWGYSNEIARLRKFLE